MPRVSNIKCNALGIHYIELSYTSIFHLCVHPTIRILHHNVHVTNFAHYANYQDFNLLQNYK